MIQSFNGSIQKFMNKSNQCALQKDKLLVVTVKDLSKEKIALILIFDNFEH